MQNAGQSSKSQTRNPKEGAKSEIRNTRLGRFGFSFSDFSNYRFIDIPISLPNARNSTATAAPMPASRRRGLSLSAK